MVQGDDARMYVHLSVLGAGNEETRCLGFGNYIPGRGVEIKGVYARAFTERRGWRADRWDETWPSELARRLRRLLI